MSLQQLINIIFYKTSKWMMNEGNKVYKDDLVLNVKSKKVHNFYNIYGKVTDNGEVNQYNTHIRINLDKKSLEETECGCEDFIENSVYNKTFLCKHLLATTYKFQELAFKKVKIKEKNEDEKGKNGLQSIILTELRKHRDLNEKLNIDIKLSFQRNEVCNYYEAEFKIGKSNMYIINNLQAFIEARNKGDSFFISNDFIFNPKINYFSYEDEAVINFIEEYVLINSFFQCNTGRNIKILPNALRRFLETIKNKKINIKYEYLDCTIPIINKDLPLSFTLKEDGENFILIPRNKLPSSLTFKSDVYLLDREIYLPSESQIEIYKVLYDYLKKDRKIIFNKSREVLEELITQLNRISRDIILDEGVKSFVFSLLKWKFYFHKECEEIFCEVKMCYGEEIIDIVSDSKKKCDLIRDFKKEEKIEIALQKFRFIKKDGKFLYVGNDLELYNLLTKGLKNIKKIGDVILTEEFKSIKVYNSNSIQASIVESEDEKLRLFYSVGDVETGEFQDMLIAFKSNRSFYKTKNNSFIDFNDEGVKDFLNLLENLNWNNDINGESFKIDKNMAYYLENNINNKNLNFIKGKDIVEHISNKIRGLDDIDYKVPRELNASLREYQVSGYKWLKTLSYMDCGGILADEMGLGKTIQTISFLLSEIGTKSLIVTPTSLIYNWKSEFEKFAPKLKLGIIHGDREERINILDRKEDYDVLLTTYGTLRNDFEFYKDISFDYCIIDEGQNIKNPLAQNTDTVKNINAKVKFALTGTPIENNLIELWSIFDFVMPGYLYTKEKFEEKFIKTRENNLEELRTLIRPFILRREKDDVLKELPDKIEKKFLVEMTPMQNLVYRSYMQEVREKLKNNKENKITIFSYLTKLRQLCLDPSLVIDDYLGGSGKVELALKLVREGIDEGKKILLFSQFTSVLKNILKMLDNEGIKYLYLDGSTNASSRVNMVNEFNKSDTIKIFLISLKAGGTGLNLTSANIVIHFDPWWNPAIENQATDRAHRIGQKNSVHVIKLISQGTIEEKIIKLQEDKKELINNVMNGELQNGQLLNSLSEEEIMDLFN